MLNYKSIIDRKFSTSEFKYSFSNEYDYSTLEWDPTNPIDKPTKEWIEQKAIKYKFIDERNALNNRVLAYPSINSQLDMLWHMMDDETIPGKNSEWYNTILSVKEQYPKPE